MSNNRSSRHVLRVRPQTLCYTERQIVAGHDGGMQCLIEHYIRQPDGRWLLAEYSTLAATVRIDAIGIDAIGIDAIGCELALADIYYFMKKVELDSSESSGGTQDV